MSTDDIGLLSPLPQVTSRRRLPTLARRFLMQFGFCYIPDYYEHLHGSYSAWYRRLLHEWGTADALGYDALWIAEHRFAGYAFCSTPVVAQAIADRTEQIRIGTAVSLISQRHPVLTAEDWAAVDLLSNGRLNFGIGRGIFAYDFGAVGVPSSESRERFQEAWEVIRRLWTEEHVTHSGKFWSFEDHTLGPRPLQQPTPPVYVACIATPESYQWAGEQGCHLMIAPFLLKSTSQQVEYLDLYRESLAKAGHDVSNFQILGNYHLALVEDERQSEQIDGHIFKYLNFLNSIQTNQKQHLDTTHYAAYESGETLWKDAQELRDNRAVTGTPQQCIDRIEELSAACGLTGWMFHINYGGVPHERVIDQMHMFAEEVMPKFKAMPSCKKTEDNSRRQSLSLTPSTPERTAAASARRITELATSYTRSCVLFAANKLDIFTLIGGSGRSSGEVARQLAANPRSIERLLDSCTSLGLLSKQAEGYHLTADSRKHLDRSSPNSIADWVAHWADMMVKGNWQELAELVRAGKPLDLDWSKFGFDNRRPSIQNWIDGMHQMALAGHADIVSKVEPLNGAAKLLDVGGGPGTYSIVMCRHYPELQATVLDSTEVSDVGCEIVRREGLDGRVRFRIGDFCTENLQENYDVILLSNVLHMVDEPGAMAMLKNAHRHLTEQGILLVQEWMVSDDGTASTLSTLFNLHMLINPNGDLYRWGQLRQMIEHAGFAVTQSLETGGVYDVIVAKKSKP
ncbi:LLM class flavin-dependent oxidoreductase [Bythopirellula polymerisocia]|uniref:Alkanal monooxygenase alpha chain n=1 Tax=Bythopirellula polymerisocia TaxID=2528003 RepID=A0A5C6CNS6_9BACT|nr:LLM class flavin-dependent oxidoreductase [Bythopirellula polymerisocia]TWU26038.1 Alkanal monooxygenase alpha chain [Bythopirellula polymerisocia]